MECVKIKKLDKGMHQLFSSSLKLTTMTSVIVLIPQIVGAPTIAALLAVQVATVQIGNLLAIDIAFVRM